MNSEQQQDVKERARATLRVLETGLLVRPHDAEKRYLLGLALEELGEEAKAADAYERSIANDTKHGKALLRLARLRKRQGLATAVTLYERAALADPSNLEPWLEVAETKGDLAAYERALAIDPSSLRALEGAARLLASGTPAQALRAIELRRTVVRLAPSARAHYELAYALLAHGDDCVPAIAAARELGGDPCALERLEAAARRASGDLEGSARALERALVHAPHDAALLVTLGQTLLDAKHPAEAALVLERARALGANVWLALGHARLHAADAQGAALAYREVIDDEDGRLGLARSLFALGHTDEAQDALATLLTIAPRGDVLVLASRLARIAGDAERALVLAERAVRTCPEDGEASLLLGKERLAHGDALTARLALERSVALSDTLEARVLLAEALVVAQENEEALRACDQARALGGDVDFLEVIALCGAGRASRARGFEAELASWSALHPRDLRAIVLEADLRLDAGEVDAGLALLSRASVLAPSDVVIARAQGCALARAGRDADACSAFARAGDAAPVDVLRAWGTALVNLRSLGDAARVLRRIPRLERTVEDWLALGRAHRGSGETLEAIESYKHVLALGGPELESTTAIGELSLARCDFSTALQSLERASSLAPHDESLALAHGIALARNERHDDAIAKLAPLIAGRQARLETAKAHLAMGRPAEAAGFLAQLLAENDCDAVALALLAEARFSLGLFDAGVDALDRARVLTADPEELDRRMKRACDPDALLGRAIELADAPQQALPVLEWLVSLHPSHVEGLFALGRVRAMSGDPAGAMDAYRALKPLHRSRAEELFRVVRG